MRFASRGPRLDTGNNDGRDGNSRPIVRELRGLRSATGGDLDYPAGTEEQEGSGGKANSFWRVTVTADGELILPDSLLRVYLYKGAQIAGRDSSRTGAVVLEGLRDCWLTPEGNVHQVPPWSHVHFAYDNVVPKADDRVYDLAYTRVMGWVKLSENDWRATRGVMQAQLEVVFDWHTVNQKHFNADLYEIR